MWPRAESIEPQSYVFPANFPRSVPNVDHVSPCRVKHYHHHFAKLCRYLYYHLVQTLVDCWNLYHNMRLEYLHKQLNMAKFCHAMTAHLQILSTLLPIQNINKPWIFRFKIYQFLVHASCLIQQLVEAFDNNLRTFGAVTIATTQHNSVVDQYLTTSAKITQTLQSIYQLQPR